MMFRITRILTTALLLPLVAATTFISPPPAQAETTVTFTCGLRNYGCYSHNGGVSIYVGPPGAHTIAGLIRDKYQSTGWENGFLGYPTSSEFCHLRDGGCGNRFEGGLVLYSQATGAHYVRGLIGDKYASMGWENSSYGYPTSDEFCGLTRGGCGQHFENHQNGSIYWSPGSGAHSVQGLIKDAWAGAGWENSWTGYPISDEMPEGDGRISKFEYGFISWHPATGIYGEGYLDSARSDRTSAVPRIGTPPPAPELERIRAAAERR